jgi:hypothetical protein
MQKVPDPLKGIVVKYPKKYKVINGGKEFRKLMVRALKEQVVARMHRPKGQEAQRENDPVNQ